MPPTGPVNFSAFSHVSSSPVMVAFSIPNAHSVVHCPSSVVPIGTKLHICKPHFTVNFSHMPWLCFLGHHCSLKLY